MFRLGLGSWRWREEIKPRLLNPPIFTLLKGIDEGDACKNKIDVKIERWNGWLVRFVFTAHQPFLGHLTPN